MNWRVGYAVFSLVYVVWVVYLSLNNFDMVHREYRRVENQLQPARIEKTAIRELVDKCRKKLKRAGRLKTAGEENTCLSWPPEVIAGQQKKVEERLVEEKRRVHRKLVIFYVFFGFVFLFLPVAFVYLLVSFSIWLFRNVKIIE